MQCIASLELLWAYLARTARESDHGTLTRAFKGVMAGMRAGQRVSPRGLFSEIARQAPRFKGYQQQDAQELLRYLVDAMAEEEIKILKQRAASAVHAAGVPSPAAAAAPVAEGTPQEPGPTCPGELKAPQTFLHGVFGGSLASLVTCSTCLHDSVTVDPCFDVSLPIPDGALSGHGKVGHQAAPAPKRGATSVMSSAPSQVGSNKKSSSGEVRAKRAFEALRKILKDEPAAEAIVQAKRKYKTLPKEAAVPVPDSAWCRDTAKRDCIVWLLSFARPQHVEQYKLLGCPMKKLTKTRAREDLISYVQMEYESLQERWLAADKFAPHGELHRFVAAVSDPVVQRALENGAHAMERWALCTQKAAHEVAHSATVAAKNQLELLASEQAGGADAVKTRDSAGTSGDGGVQDKGATLQEDGSLTVGGWRFPPAYAVGGVPPHAWPGTDPSLVKEAAQRPAGTLRACLAAFTQPERLMRKQGNAYRCLACGERAATELLDTDTSDDAQKKAQEWRKGGVKRDACKRMCFFHAPLVLTLHLNRFKQTATGRFVKNGAHVSFKRTLRMDKYFATHDSAADNGPFLYELSGVVVHGGGMGGGHYIAYTRATTGWAYASDSSTSSAPEAKALGQQAYILFYTRVNPAAKTSIAAHATAV